MSEELTSVAIPAIGKIIMVAVGVAGLFAFSKSGDNSYMFDIGSNLLLAILVIAAMVFIIVLLDRYMTYKVELVEN